MRADQPAVDLDALEAPPDKIIAETAILLRAAAAVPAATAPGIARRARALARALVPYARHARTAVGIALHPALARDYAVAHLILTRLGFPDAAFHRALVAALAAPTAQARERVPHRELEQGWLDTLASAPVPDGLLARTALGRGVDVVTGSRDDVYALTHAVMYGTDFGRRPLPPGIPVDAVLATAESALAGALDDDDFDLAGELLLIWPYVGAPWQAVPSFAFRVLARVEDEVGVLPSLAIDCSAYDRQPPASRWQYLAAVTYHTAYVMGLLCASLLTRRRGPSAVPPCAPPSVDRGPAAVSELLARLATDARPRRPQWMHEASARPAVHLHGTESLLVDVALRRAMRRLDLDAARQILEIGAATGAMPSTLQKQAAGILHRLAASAVLVVRADRASQRVGRSPRSPAFPADRHPVPSEGTPMR